jgi:thiol:disulfide interchange protein DsbG
MLYRSLYVFLVLLCLHAAALSASLPKSRQVANALLEDIDQATWVTQGAGDRVLYIFFDPNCPYCHKLYGMLDPLVGPEHLRLRWIPVALLSSSSLPKAAAILQAPDPLAAFRENEDNYGMRDDGPGGFIAPASRIRDEVRLDIETNLSLLQGQNIAVVPVTVLCATDGQGLMFQGVPSQKVLRRILAAVRPGAGCR